MIMIHCFRSFDSHNNTACDIFIYVEKFTQQNLNVLQSISYLRHILKVLYEQSHLKVLLSLQKCLLSAVLSGLQVYDDATGLELSMHSLPGWGWNLGRATPAAF